MEPVEKTDEINIDFITGTSMPKDALKYIWLLIPNIWISGTLTMLQFLAFWRDFAWIPLLFFLLLPLVILADTFIFTISSLLISKALLILIELIHKPREGIFHIKKNKREYKFWCIRKLLKKYAIWFLRNSPIAWIDIIGQKMFGVKCNFSNSLQDSWLDFEFIEIGNKTFIGQGSAVLSSMIVGDYLIIKKVILENQVVVGGQASVSPGTIIRKNTILGACSVTSFNQELEANWVYLGIPARKYKPNKYAKTRDQIVKFEREIDGDIAKKIKIEEED